MKKTILLSLLTTFTLAGHADEGMWMLTDLKKQNAAVMARQHIAERCSGTLRWRMYR